MSRIFDDPFRKTLGEILRGAPRLRGGSKNDVRTQRRRRSESGTFSGHRAYGDGDDLRNLDWNVYARTDELFMKVLEDEDRVGLTLIVDRSASMTVEDRWRGALRLASILGGLALVHLDGLRVVWGSSQESTLSGAAAVGRLLETLENLQSLDESPATTVRQLLEISGGGRVFWVSDFADPRSFEVPLSMMHRQGCRCTGWLPSLPTDRRPTAHGMVRFLDPETGKREVLQVDEALRRAMTEELSLLRNTQAGVFKAAGYPLLRFEVPEPGDYRISAWSDRGRVYAL